MNPSSPSLISRSSTSSAIQSAHAALTEKARETGYITNPTSKRIEQSPERFLVKGVVHKRFKSLQPGVRDLSNYLEGGSAYVAPRSPEKNTTRSGTPSPIKDVCFETKSPEKESRYAVDGRYSSKTLDRDMRLALEKKSFESDDRKESENEEESCRSEIPTPSHNDIQRRDLSNLRIPLKRSPRSILGENIPPQSATMLALQSMASKDQDVALTNTTSSSTALVRTPQTFDAISNQILSLTSIATSLQREMAQLSRRSKDNATDLVSLKEATNARDEDIRKSLRELVHNLNEAGTRSSSNTQGSGGLYLDNKAHNSPASRGTKSYNVTHMSSPSAYAASIDRDSIVSPTSYVADGFAIIALLEKVLRDMGTKEGQEQLLSHLTELAERLSYDESSTMKKVDELMKLIKDNTSNALITTNQTGTNPNKPRTFSFDQNSRLELDFDHSASCSLTPRAVTLGSPKRREDKESEIGRASDVLNEEVTRIIRTIKDSVTQGGGLTAEVKALVRELRGEVLGMGREIGRKLDEANEETTKSFTSDKEHVTRLAKNSVEDLKNHLDQILREYRRQSAASFASKSTVDYQEIHNSVRRALQEAQSQNQAIQKENVFEAVKDAWENYKPEIEFQQFGLERNELLTCLKDGIEMYAPQNYAPSGATREEVFEAIVEGLKHLPSPEVDTQASLTREEILEAFKECLEEFEFPSAPLLEPVEIGITKDDVLNTVIEGLNSFDFSTNITSSVHETDISTMHDNIVYAVKEGLKSFNETSETSALVRGSHCDNLSREELYEAVKAGLRDSPGMEAIADQIFKKLQEILDSIHIEFEALSKDTIDNINNSGLITQKFLNENNDSFDRIHAEIKYLTNKAANFDEVKEPILESFRQGLETIRADLALIVSRDSTTFLETIHSEIENLRGTLSTSIIPRSEAENNEIKDALNAGLKSINKSIAKLLVPKTEASNEELLKALSEGFNSLHNKMSTSLVSTASSEKFEILEAFKCALEDVKETMSTSLVSGSLGIEKKEISDAINEALETVKETMSTSLVSGAIGEKDEILKALSEGFEGMKEIVTTSLNSQTRIEDTDSRNDGIIKFLKDNIASVKETISSSISSSNAAEKGEIIQALKDGMQNIQESILASQSVDNTKGQNDDIIKFLKDSVEEAQGKFLTSSTLNGIAEDKEIISDIKSSIENLKDIITNSSISSTTTDKDGITKALQEEFNSTKETILNSIASNTKVEKDEIITTIQSSIESLKETFSISSASSTASEKDEIISAFRSGLEEIKEKISNSIVSTLEKENIVDTLKQEFESLKETISNSVVSNSSSENHSALESLKNSINTIQEKISAPVVFDTSVEKNEMIEALKSSVENFISASLIPSTASKNSIAQDQILENLKDSLSEIRQTILNSSTSDPATQKDEIIDALKTGLESIQKPISEFFVSGSGDSFDALKYGLEIIILDVINEGLDSIRETISTSITSNITSEKDEILNAFNNGIESIREIFSNSNSSTSNVEQNEIVNNKLDGIQKAMSNSFFFRAGAEKDGILDTFNEGLNSIRETISSSIASSTDAEKEKILEAIKNALDSAKESMLTSLIPSASTETQKILDALNAGFESLMEKLSTSVNSNSCADKKDIFEAIQKEFQGIKETISSSIDHNNNSKQDSLLQLLKDSVKDIQDMITTSASSNISNEKNEILEALKDGFGSMQERTSTSLVSNSSSEKDELIMALKEIIEKLNTTMSTSIVSTPPNEKNEILDAINNGFESTQKAMSTSLVSKNISEYNEIKETLTNAVEGIKEAISSSSTNINEKDEITSAVKNIVESLKESMSTSLVSSTTEEREKILESLKSEFDSIKETVLARDENTGTVKEEIIQALTDALTDGVESIKETILISIVSNNSNEKDEITNTFKDLIDNLKETLSTMIISSISVEKDEIINAFKDTTETFKETMTTSLSSSTTAEKDETLRALKDEFKGIKEAVTASLTSAAIGDKDQILETLKITLENVKETISSSLASKIEKSDLVDALNGNVEILKDEIKISRELDKQDLTTTNQSLEALKDSLGCLHSEVEKIANKSADVAPSDTILSTFKSGLGEVRNDIEQLRESLQNKGSDSEAQDTALVPIDTLKRHDIENLEAMLTQLRNKVEDIENSPSQAKSMSEKLSEFEVTITKLESSVVESASQSARIEGEFIKKDDVKDIETLLRNLKAKIDEIDPKVLAEKEDLNPLKLILEGTQGKVNNLADCIGSFSTKTDVEPLELLLQDILIGVKDLKDVFINETQNPEKVTKTDVDAVEAACLDIKTSIDQILTSDIAALASNDDVKNLEDLVKELRQKIDEHAHTNVKSFEQRQADIQEVGGKVVEVKVFLEELKHMVKTKLEEGLTGVENLGSLLGGFEENEKIRNTTISGDIKALSETMKQEFEKSIAGVVGSKLESDEKFEQTWGKFDAKFEEKFGELITRYDDAKATAEAASGLHKQNAVHVEAALQKTQAATDDLKELAGVLNASFTKSMEKTDENSQTVISHIEKFHSMVDNSYTDIKVEHQLARDDMAKTLASIERVDDTLSKHNPKIMGQIENLITAVGKNFEHSKQSLTTLQDKVVEGLSSPLLLPPPPPPAVEKYDDTPVHEKLDKLINFMHDTDKSLSQLAMLDEIYQQIKKNAAEVAEYLTMQNKRNKDEYKEKEKAAQAAAIALERKLTKKKFVEAAVAELREEEKQLKNSISDLKAETNDLYHQKMRLYSDVSSLETALKIRREELQIVEARAEGLERRILEGVIDHSRALLISKANKGRDAMNRKRVPSYASSASSSSGSLASILPQSTVNVVIGSKGSTLSVPVTSSPGVSRRILSLSQINNNTSSGGLKRSHSVRVPSDTKRKSSWRGTLSQKYDELNDKNLEIKENIERNLSDAEESDNDGTIRRSSMGISQHTGMESEIGETRTNSESEWTESVMSGDTNSKDESDSETIVIVDGASAEPDNVSANSPTAEPAVAADPTLAD
ncbi:hypothetical protein K3495_g1253 [Podosphaera aphanis]|nr:hypothetical protein K3495_g1253 [Podosphaera aphanis]